MTKYSPLANLLILMAFFCLLEAEELKFDGAFGKWKGKYEVGNQYFICGGEMQF